MKKLILTSTMTIALASTASASDFFLGTPSDTSNLYVGAGVGFVGGSSSKVCDTWDIDCTSWKTYAGWRISDNFALEAGYQGLRSDRVNDGGTKLETTVMSANAIYSKNLSDRFEAFGKLGLGHWRTNVTEFGTEVGKITKINSTDFILGGGLQTKFTDSLGLRAEIDHIFGDESTTSYNASIFYSTY